MLEQRNATHGWVSDRVSPFTTSPIPTRRLYLASLTARSSSPSKSGSAEREAHSLAATAGMSLREAVPTPDARADRDSHRWFTNRRCPATYFQSAGWSISLIRPVAKSGDGDELIG
jgi:hypothetical protein